MSELLVNILESFLGENRKWNDDSGQISFDCPCCSEESGKHNGDGKGNLEVNYNKNVFKCWVCYETNHMHGGVVKLIRRHGTPKNLRDYILIKPDADSFDQTEREEIVVTLPKEYKKLVDCGPKDYKYNEVIKYLSERGITDDIIKEYEIGYINSGPLFNRVIIPSFDSFGDINYYVARWFSDDPNKMKYINPEAEKQLIIFNENKINWDSTIYLVEGVFDHIVVPNSIPLLGKYVSDLLFDLLYSKSTSNIVIFLDSDAYADSVLLYNKLNFCDLRGRISIITPPDGYDPSKVFEKFGSKGIVQLLKRSYKLH